MKNIQDIMHDYPKYVDSKVVFEEIPDCVTLAVTISNCPFRCKGCHSDYLRKNVGDNLTNEAIDDLLSKNKGVNCFLFLGDGLNIDSLCDRAFYIKNKYPSIKTAVYSGYDYIISEYKEVFDYVKTGKWIESKGPLHVKTTNQRLFKIVDGIQEDITYKFWQRI